MLVAALKWLEEQWEIPSRSDWYMMQVAQVMFNKPIPFTDQKYFPTTNEFKIKFIKPEPPKPPTPEELKEISERMRAKILARAGGKRVTVRYGPPAPA
jgi:hypothetical protein